MYPFGRSLDVGDGHADGSGPAGGPDPVLVEPSLVEPSPGMADPQRPPAMTDEERGRALGVATARCRDLAARIAVLEAELVDAGRVVAELAGRHLCDMTATQWLAWQAGLTPAEAARTMRLGRRLADLPQLGGAYRAGELSTGTVETLTRVATPVNEAALLATARVATAAQLQTLVRTYQQVTDPDDDGGEFEESMTSRRDPSGRFHQFTLRLHPDHAAEVDAALRAIIDDDWHDRHHTDDTDDTTDTQGTEPADTEPADTEPADTEPADTEPADTADKADTVDAAGGAHPGGGVGEVAVPLSRVEAFLALVRDHLAGRVTAAGVLPDRHQVIIHAELDAVTSGVTFDDGCFIHGGAALDPSRLGELCCNSLLRGLLRHGGEPLWVTQATRTATPAQLAALQHRDICCRYPGCGRTRRLHAHHVTHHHHGGPTRLDNLTLLCDTHHGRIHRTGWTCTWQTPPARGRPGRLLITRPDGTTVTGRAGRPKPPPTDTTDTGDTGGPGAARAGPRHTGTHERLTPYAKNVILDTWQRPRRDRPGDATPGGGRRTVSRQCDRS